MLFLHGDILVKNNIEVVVRHLRRITTSSFEGHVEVLVIHSLHESVHLVAGMFEHRTALIAEHHSRNRLNALCNHAIPMSPQLGYRLQSSNAAHEVINLAVGLVDMFQNVDTSPVCVQRELEFNFIPGVCNQPICNCLLYTSDAADEL